jgi:hypothetical protein
LKLAPASSLPFVGRLLDHAHDAIRESAALALGGARLRDAFPVLSAWWERTPQTDLRRTALLAIAMLKHDEPIQFLLSLIREGDGPSARDAIAALAIYKHDDALVLRVRTAAARRDLDLRAALAAAFD